MTSVIKLCRGLLALLVPAIAVGGGGCELVIGPGERVLDPTFGSGGLGTGSGGTGGGSVMCSPGKIEPCYDGLPGTEGHGICHGGTHVCQPDGTSFGDCMNEQVPKAEDYSMPGDENCDGMASADTTWVDTSGDPAGADQVIYGVAANAAGDVVIAGSFGGTITIGMTTTKAIGPGADVLVAKLTAAGLPAWVKHFGGGGANAVAVTGKGEVVVAGSSSNPIDFGAPNGAVPAGVFVVKLDGNGNTLWSRGCPSASLFSSPTSIGVDAQGNITVGGNFSGDMDCGGGALTTNASPGMFVAQFAPDGSPGWAKKFDAAPDNSAQNLAAIAVESGGSIWLTGSLQGTVDFGGGSLLPGGSDPGDLFLVKLDANGVQLNANVFGDNALQGGTAVAVDGHGNAFVTGYNQGTMDFVTSKVVAIGALDVVIAKFDSNGFNIWSKGFGGAQGQSSGLTLGIESTGDVVLGGSTSERIDLGSGTFLSDNAKYAFLARYDNLGGFIWSKYYGGDKMSFDAMVTPHSMALTSAKDIVLGGEFFQSADFGKGAVSPAVSSHDAFIMQVAP